MDKGKSPNTEKTARTMLARMVRASSILLVAFRAIFVLYAVFAVMVAVVSIVGIAELSVQELVPEVITVLTLLMGGFAIAIICTVFKDMAHGRSPFSSAQARRLLALGVWLLVCVIAEALASMTGCLYSTSAIVTADGGSIQAGATIMRFNATMFFSAIGCFCLSYVFKYGSLLQWLYDETV